MADDRRVLPTVRYPVGMEPGQGTPQAGAVVPGSSLPKGEAQIQGIVSPRPVQVTAWVPAAANWKVTPGNFINVPLIGTGGQVQVPTVPDGCLLRIVELRTLAIASVQQLPEGILPFTSPDANSTAPIQTLAQRNKNTNLRWNFSINGVATRYVTNTIIREMDVRGVLWLRPGETLSVSVNVTDIYTFFTYVGASVRGVIEPMAGGAK